MPDEFNPPGLPEVDLVKRERLGKRLVIATLVALGVMFVAAQLFPDPSNSRKVVEPKTPVGPQVIRKTADEVSKAFRENEISGEEELKGARVWISGRVDSISTDILGSPYIMLATESHPQIQCVFPREARVRVATLRKGEIAIASCAFSGKLINVIFNECSLF